MSIIPPLLVSPSLFPFYQKDLHILASIKLDSKAINAYGILRKMAMVVDTNKKMGQRNAFLRIAIRLKQDTSSLHSMEVLMKL
jgi:hypothetical protein